VSTKISSRRLACTELIRTTEVGVRFCLIWIHFVLVESVKLMEVVLTEAVGVRDGRHVVSACISIGDVLVC
jgi:hypothetical protein